MNMSTCNKYRVTNSKSGEVGTYLTGSRTQMFTASKLDPGTGHSCEPMSSSYPHDVSC
jgi:hypothetical protein